MIKASIIASALCLSLAGPTLAAPELRQGEVIVTNNNPAFRADVVEVETHRPAGAIILTDAFGGAVAGAVVGGGVAFYNRYVSDSKNWGNWQQDLAIGAAVGLGVGLIFGIVDAASVSSGPAYVTPVADRRETGFSAPVAMYGGKY